LGRDALGERERLRAGEDRDPQGARLVLDLRGERTLALTVEERMARHRPGVEITVGLGLHGRITWVRRGRSASEIKQRAWFGTARTASSSAARRPPGREPAYPRAQTRASPGRSRSCARPHLPEGPARASPSGYRERSGPPSPPPRTPSRGS